MIREEYRLAGWAAIASAILFLPVMGLVFYHDVMVQPALGGSEPLVGLLMLIVGLDILSKILGIYAILRFRTLLNERYDFHAVDNLIILLVGFGVALGGISYAVRFVGMNVALIAVGVILGVTTGILGLVFALRLLRLPASLNGYLKPLAYTQLVSSICLMLVVTAVVGLVLEIVFSVILGMVFLSRQEDLEQLEFV